MRRLFLQCLGGMGLLLCGIQVSAAEPAPFIVGVAPHTSARVILEMYQPLRRNLEKVLKQAVEIQTAPDFTEFLKRAANQDYDIVITTGHQARLLQTDANYLPLITYQAEFKAVALVPKESKIQLPADLKGSTVLGLSPSSLVTLWGLHWLKTQKIYTDLNVRFVSAADSVARQVLAGEASACFTSLANYQKLPPDIRDQLRILAESEPMAGRVYLLNKRWSGRQAVVDKALWGFSATPEGKQYFEQNKLEGYRKLRAHELEAMDPYAAETRLQLQGK